MEPHLVSVIIPAYNAEAYIKNSVDCVNAQTYRPLQVVVVDDGSTDRTGAVVQGIDGVTCIRQENGGPSKARNTGIRNAKGEFVAFLDADDTWIPGKLEMQMKLFHEHPELDLVFSDAEITRRKPKERTFTVFGEKKLGKAAFHSEWQVPDALERILRDNFITTSSVVARKPLFAHAEFNPHRRFAEDWELWLQLTLHATIGYVDAVCVKKIEDGGGLSARRRDMLLSRLEVFEMFVTTNRGRITMPDGELETLERETFIWAACWLQENGDSENAREFYRKALRKGWDAKTALKYVTTFLPAKALSTRG